VDCAIALSAQIATSTNEAKQNRRNLLITGELLKEISIVEDHCAREPSGAELTETSANVLDCLFRRKNCEQVQKAVSIMTIGKNASVKPECVCEKCVNEIDCIQDCALIFRNNCASLLLTPRKSLTTLFAAVIPLPFEEGPGVADENLDFL
jgi:hypothetical protein